MARLAATVMLVRPSGERGFEVLMLRRSQASHFVPDAYVFPGGTVDEADTSQRALARMHGIGDDLLCREFRARSAPQFPSPVDPPDENQARGLLVAALRELYEEAGVLLARDDLGEPITAGSAEPSDRTKPYIEKLEELNAYGDAGALALFSQWVTPPVYPKRYNAHFFLAVASREQAASADAVETHDGLWIAPQTALNDCELGKFRMVYPTIKHVERLAKFHDVQELMKFARTKPIYTIMPDAGEDTQFSLPDDLEFAW